MKIHLFKVSSKYSEHNIKHNGQSGHLIKIKICIREWL